MKLTNKIIIGLSVSFFCSISLLVILHLNKVPVASKQIEETQIEGLNHPALITNKKAPQDAIQINNNAGDEINKDDKDIPTYKEDDKNIIKTTAASGEQFIPLVVEAIARFGGNPVEGARLSGGPIEVEFGGNKIINSNLISNASLPYLNTPSSNDGSVGSTLTFKSSMGGEWPFIIAAYHPDKGLGIMETTLGELIDGKKLILNLVRGKAVRGRVLDNDRQPLSGAAVRLDCSWRNDDPPFTSIHTVTKSDGAFLICGIQFSNQPNIVHAWYFIERPEFKNLQHVWNNPRSKMKLAERINVEDKYYDDQTETWEIGDIIISKESIPRGR